jgi:hypothetical protein
MADLQQMSRVLYHHDWTNVEDWARNVDELADLNDDEIGQLEHCNDACCSVVTVAAPDHHRQSLLERTRLGLLSLCESLRYGARRTC